MSLLQLILLAPLLTSTAYLQFATDETFFFSLFFRPPHSAKSAALLPSYLSHFSRPAILIISATLGLQLVTSIAAATALYDGVSASWYWSGFALTLAHFLFAPWAAPRLAEIAAMKAGKPKEDEVRRRMDAFLKVHALRTWTVNVGAWLCFAVAVLRKMG